MMWASIGGHTPSTFKYLVDRFWSYLDHCLNLQDRDCETKSRTTDFEMNNSNRGRAVMEHDQCWLWSLDQDCGLAVDGQKSWTQEHLQWM